MIMTTGDPTQGLTASDRFDLVNCQNAAVNTAMGLSPANSNGVNLRGVSSGDFALQTVIEKVNELITALRW